MEIQNSIPLQTPQAYPPAPVVQQAAPAPVVMQTAPPIMQSDYGDGGGMSMSKPITKELWIGFFFAFLTGTGIGYIYNERQKGKFPKLF